MRVQWSGLFDIYMCVSSANVDWTNRHTGTWIWTFPPLALSPFHKNSEPSPPHLLDLSLSLSLSVGAWCFILRIYILSLLSSLLRDSQPSCTLCLLIIQFFPFLYLLVTKQAENHKDHYHLYPTAKWLLSIHMLASPIQHPTSSICISTYICYISFMPNYFCPYTPHLYNVQFIMFSVQIFTLNTPSLENLWLLSFD